MLMNTGSFRECARSGFRIVLVLWIGALRADQFFSAAKQRRPHRLRPARGNRLRGLAGRRAANFALVERHGFPALFGLTKWLQKFVPAT
jgi:hypothetical protein